MAEIIPHRRRSAVPRRLARPRLPVLFPTRGTSRQLSRAADHLIVDCGVVPPQTLEVSAAVRQRLILKARTVAVVGGILVPDHPLRALLGGVEGLLALNAVARVADGGDGEVEAGGGDVEVVLAVAGRVSRRAVVRRLQDDGARAGVSGDVGLSGDFEALAASGGKPVVAPHGVGDGCSAVKFGTVDVAWRRFKQSIGVAESRRIRISKTTATSSTRAVPITSSRGRFSCNQPSKSEYLEHNIL